MGHRGKSEAIVAQPVAGSPHPGAKAAPSIPQSEGWRRLHLVGIGGAGMSGIAKLLLARGLAVTGSDLKWSRGLLALEELGAVVWVGHRAEQLGAPDAVVVSSAIRPENPEVVAAHAAGIPVLMRAQVLAALMRDRRGVAVAGTHGKTTTTSMISVMLSRMGRSPSFVIGGDLNESGSGAEHGTGEAFVAEADESDGSFLVLRPEVAVVTNVEPDHLDYYGSVEAVEDAFGRFAAGAEVVVACWDDPGVRRALSSVKSRLLRYGTDGDLEFGVRSVELSEEGSTAQVGTPDGAVTLRLRVAGQHNVLNASAAVGVAHALGLPLEDAADALGRFTGVRRRFERRGAARGAVFVDDYAHHPTEVAATLEVARMGRGNGSSGSGRVVAVFQPHRYTRTQSMWRPLGESLREADLVVVTDVYGAGEDPIPGVSGKLVVEALAEAAPGKRVVYLPRRSDVADVLEGLIRDGDLVLTLGAGDITMVGDETLELIRRTEG